MSIRSVAAFATLALSLTAVGVAAAHPAAAHTANVKVTAKDFSFALSPKTVAHGRVTFEIKNSGAVMHDFDIAGHRSKTVGPGKSTTLTVTRGAVLDIRYMTNRPDIVAGCDPNDGPKKTAQWFMDPANLARYKADVYNV